MWMGFSYVLDFAEDVGGEERLRKESAEIERTALTSVRRGAFLGMEDGVALLGSMMAG